MRSGFSSAYCTLVHHQKLLAHVAGSRKRKLGGDLRFQMPPTLQLAGAQEMSKLTMTIGVEAVGLIDQAESGKA